jgi:hypothetical protein
MNLGFRRFINKALALGVFIPAVIASTGDCPGTGGAVPVTRNGQFATGPGQGSTDLTTFDVPAAPEQPLTANFTVTSSDAIAPEDVSVVVVLTCGVSPQQSVIPVTMNTDGLTRLRGSFSQAGNLCIASNGQRTPAYWSIRLQRIAAQDMNFAWDAAYTSYIGVGQERPTFPVFLGLVTAPPASAQPSR